MPKRERNLRLHIMVSHDELAAIHERIEELRAKLARSKIRNER